MIGRIDGTNVDALLGTVAELYSRGLIPQIADFVASYSLWLVQAVEDGDVIPDDATTAFASLDVCMREQEGLSLSETVENLIVEGEHLHHFGDNSLPEAAPDLARMRDLAMRILVA